jgi:hypothetical protein
MSSFVMEKYPVGNRTRAFSGDPAACGDIEMTVVMIGTAPTV